MKRAGDRVRLSASDVADFVECRHKMHLASAFCRYLELARTVS